MALVVGLFGGVLAITASLSHAEEPDAKTAPKNAAGNRASNVAPIKRPDPNANIMHWLEEASTQPANEEFEPTPEPDRSDRVRRPDALPGVAELSNGRQMPGRLYTTRGKTWDLWVPEEKSWRRIPPIAVLSATATVEEEEIEHEWRWKAMGVDERVYTGNWYPIRRLSWTFRLIDGTTLKGELKGQPLWIELEGSVMGPLVLHERMKGPNHMPLKDFLYLRKFVISQTMMEAVIKDLIKNPPKDTATSQPATRRAR